MVGETEFLRAMLTAKNKLIKSLLLSQSMLRDELLCSYKSASGKISAEGICDNTSVSYSYKYVYIFWTLTLKIFNDCIDVDTILKEINKSLTKNDNVLETINENANTNFNDMLQITFKCVIANDANSGLCN